MMTQGKALSTLALGAAFFTASIGAGFYAGGRLREDVSPRARKQEAVARKESAPAAKPAVAKSADGLEGVGVIFTTPGQRSDFFNGLLCPEGIASYFVGWQHDFREHHDNKARVTPVPLTEKDADAIRGICRVLDNKH
jgi:hypothetical protein